MSSAIVGRIFWKELRTQRSLWICVTCLVIAVQTAATALSFYYYGHRLLNLEELIAGIFLAAYVGTTVYAIASGAASFAEEIEGNTATLLRTVPMTRSEAFAGKWGYGLASAGLLFLVLALAAGVLSFADWTAAQNPGAFEGLTTPRNTRFFTGNWSELFALVWIWLMVPVVFFAFCSLYSLLMSDGLIAALCGTFSAIFALVWVSWVLRLSPLGVQPIWGVTSIAVALAATDLWLTGVWLRHKSLIRWTGKWPVEWVGEQPLLTKPVAGPIALLRAGEPAVPWKRAAQRLVWKEVRQAWPYVGMILLAGTAMVTWAIIDPTSRLISILTPGIVGLAAPLAMGVGAYHVDQKSRAYHLLGDRGLTPDGSWLAKHVVWIALTFAVCGYVLVIDWAACEFAQWEANSPRYFRQNLWERAAALDILRTSAGWDRRGSSAYASLGVVVLYIALAYSIGQRLSFVYAKGLLAFGLAIGTTLLAGMIWATFAARGVPISWTIGVIPPVLLGYTWTHTRRWHIEQLYSYGWVLVAAWMVLPLVGIATAVALYWPLLRHWN
jgi:hypothetical protein